MVVEKVSLKWPLPSSSSLIALNYKKPRLQKQPPVVESRVLAFCIGMRRAVIDSPMSGCENTRTGPQSNENKNRLLPFSLIKMVTLITLLTVSPH